MSVPARIKSHTHPSIEIDVSCGLNLYAYIQVILQSLLSLSLLTIL